MKNKCIVILIISVLLVQYSKAQDILTIPNKYYYPNKNISTAPVPEAERSIDRPWVVMAISDNSSAKSDIGSNERGRPVKFGELFMVIGESGNYVKIAKDNQRNDLVLSSNADIYGWISKDDLLLWQSSLVNSESRIPAKGMILNTSRAIQSGNVTFRRIQSYKDPALQTQTPFEAQLYEIFYIYKYSPRHNSVLLARAPYFNPNLVTFEQANNLFVGWVDLDKVLEWDHRVALEPNFQPHAIEKRRQNNIRASVLNPASGTQPEKCAVDFSRGQTSTECDIAWNDDLYNPETGEIEGRKNSYWRRFPVLGNESESAFKVMVMGELTGETGVINEDIDIAVKEKLNSVIDKIRNINIVFVIDGTNSMAPYYESAVNAVEKIVEIFEMSGQDYKQLRFGYVIYRDFLEQNRMIETRQLTIQSDQIVNALKNVKAEDVNDRDTPEAVYLGLKTAFNNVLRDKDETNIIIHLGDAGNHHRNDNSQVQPSELVKLFAEYNVFYSAFQVHHDGQHQAYTDFPHQLREIISRASMKQYEQWIEFFGESIVTQRPILSEIRPNLHRISGGAPMVVMAAGKNQTMDIKKLEEEITNAVFEMDKYIDLVVDKSREMLERGQGIDVIAGEAAGVYGSSFAPGVYNMLLKMGVSEDMIKNYYSKNLQFVTEGFVPKYHQSLDDPLFTSSLLLSSLDFMRIVADLSRLTDATSSAIDKRNNLFNAWIELLKRHEGIRNAHEFENFTLEEANARVFGIPVKAGMLNEIKLKDITDPSVFPDNKLNLYINHIAFKFRELNNISNTSGENQYAFRSNDILYYWLPIDMLP